MNDIYGDAARRLLQRGEGPLPHTAPLSDIERRGRQLQSRQRLQRGLLATGVCAAVLLIAVVATFGLRTQTNVALDSGQRADVDSPQEVTVDQGASPTPGPDTCEAPLERPTYLPWLHGRPVGQPEVWRGGPEDGDSVQLTWFRDPNASPEKTFYVALRRLTEPAGTGGGTTTDVRLASVAGKIGRGTQAGDAWMGWDVGGQTCNLIELELTTSGAYSAAQAEREILRIAESLSVPAPTQSPESAGRDR